MKSKIILLFSILLLFACQNKPQPKESTTPEATKAELFALANSDLNAFALKIAGETGSTYDRSKNIVTWLANNFNWTATDYKKRTVAEIVERKGGNCAELAKVTKALLKNLDFKMRQVREVNIHILDESRKGRAEEKIKEYGPRASVFGKRHNDHVWIEVYDETTGEWFPADPSLGVIGTNEWLAARYGFGERFTLDPTSEDMIAPIAIFAFNDQKEIVENRTAHYAINGFQNLYSEKLSAHESWAKWKEKIDFLDDKIEGAFKNEINLHDYEADIDELATLYQSLKESSL